MRSHSNTTYCVKLKSLNALQILLLTSAEDMLLVIFTPTILPSSARPCRAFPFGITDAKRFNNTTDTVKYRSVPDLRLIPAFFLLCCLLTTHSAVGLKYVAKALASASEGLFNFAVISIAFSTGFLTYTQQLYMYT